MGVRGRRDTATGYRKEPALLTHWHGRIYCKPLRVSIGIPSLKGLIPMFSKRHSLVLVYAFILGILLWLVLYPNLYLLVQSFLRTRHFTLEHYREFFTSPSQVQALGNSIWISAASVVLSALIGIPLAFLFTRYEFPGRQLFASLASLPVLLPPLVGVIAFLFLYGE